MKIVNAPVTTWTSNVKCASCGAELEVDQDDVRAKKHSGEGQVTWTYHVECPVEGCGKPVSLVNQSPPLPPFVLTRAQQVSPRRGRPKGAKNKPKAE